MAYRCISAQRTVVLNRPCRQGVRLTAHVATRGAMFRPKAGDRISESAKQGADEAGRHAESIGHKLQDAISDVGEKVSEAFEDVKERAQNLGGSAKESAGSAKDSTPLPNKVDQGYMKEARDTKDQVTGKGGWEEGAEWLKKQRSNLKKDLTGKE